MDTKEIIRTRIQKTAADNRRRAIKEYIAKEALDPRRIVRPMIDSSDIVVENLYKEPGLLKRILEATGKRINPTGRATDWKRAAKYGGGALAGGGAAAGGANWLMSGDETAFTDKPSPEELKAALATKPTPAAASAGSDIAPEALAGAGGAAVGGAAGAALAPTLGVGRMTGALGGGALGAIVAAVAANRMKANA